MSVKLRTDVRLAVEDGQSISEILKLFWEAHGKVVYPPIDYFKNLLLCAAVYYKHSELCTTLLADEFPVNYNAGYGSMRPLHIACKQGEKNTITQILKYGGDVNVKGSGEIDPTILDNVIATAIEIVLHHDRGDLMELMLYQYDRRQNYGKSVLHLACEQNAEKCAQHLLTKHTDVNIDDTDYNGQTALAAACKVSSRIVKMLLEHGSSVNESRTPCLIEAVYPYSYSYPYFLPTDITKVVEILLEYGEDVNSVGHDNNALGQLLRQIRNSIQQSKVDENRMKENHLNVIHVIGTLLDFNVRIDWCKFSDEIREGLSYLGDIFDNSKYESAQVVQTQSFIALIEGVKLMHEIVDMCVRRSPPIDQDLGLLLHARLLRCLPELQKALVWFNGDWSLVVDELANTFHLLYTTFGDIHLNTTLINQMCQKWPVNKTLLSLYLVNSSHAEYTNMIKVLDMTTHISNEQLNTFLEGIKLSPRSLKVLSRLVILSNVRYPRDKNVNSIHMPNALKVYILEGPHFHC